MESTISPIAAALVNSAAGTLGGITSFSLFYPLENFRTRLQTREKATKSPLAEALANVGNQFEAGVGDLSRKVEGISQKVNDQIGRLTPKPEPTLYQRLITRLQQIWSEICEGLRFAQQIYQKHGMSAFYQGLGSGVFGIGVSNAIFNYFYQLFKDLMFKFRSTLRALARSRRNPSSGDNYRHGNRHAALSPIDNILVASMAGVVNITITNPIWVINTRQTLRNNDPTTVTAEDKNSAQTTTTTTTSTTTQKEPSIWPLITKFDFKTIIARLISWFKRTELGQLLEQDGFMGLYSGYAASLVLVLNPTIQFVLYDQLVAYFSGSPMGSQQSAVDGQQQQKSNNLSSQTTTLSSAQYFLISALAKAMSTIITFPYLVVKTRMQQNNKSFVQKAVEDVHRIVKDSTGVVLPTLTPRDQIKQLTPDQSDQTDIVTEISKIKDKQEVQGLYATMVSMYQKDGAEVFFRGLAPKLVQTVLNAALTSVLHERIKDYMIDILEQRSGSM